MKSSLWMLALTITGFSPFATAEIIEVSQKGRTFQPSAVNIKVGDIVRIHNDDEFLHHVYVKSSNFNFDSEEQPPGEDANIPFTRIGDFEVLCDIHPKMKLVVHVK